MSEHSRSMRPVRMSPFSYRCTLPLDSHCLGEIFYIYRSIVWGTYDSFPQKSLQYLLLMIFCIRSSPNSLFFHKKYRFFHVRIKGSIYTPNAPKVRDFRVKKEHCKNILLIILYASKYAIFHAYVNEIWTH